MVRRYVDVDFADTLTGDYQLLVVTPDASQTERTTIQDILDLSTGGGASNYPSKTVIWGDEVTNNPANFVKFDDESLQAFNMVSAKSSANSLQGDIYQYQFEMKAGTFTLEWLGQNRNYCGIASVYIDGTLQGTFDSFSSTSTVNNLFTVPVTLLTSGEHTLEFRMLTKNASSTAYGLRTTRIRIF